MNAPSLMQSQPHFYQEFLMGRSNFDPHDFGVNMSAEEFRDAMADEFGTQFRGALSLDELLLRPRVAGLFCDQVRQRHGYYDVPDDIILRSIMHRRKNP